MIMQQNALLVCGSLYFKTYIDSYNHGHSQYTEQLHHLPTNCPGQTRHLVLCVCEPL